MHRPPSLSSAALWLLIIAVQAVLAGHKGRGLGFLKVFMGAQSVMGLALFTTCRLAGPWTYFYSWCAATLIHHGLCAYLTSQIYDVVRRRGLPSRQSAIPLYVMGAVAMFAGLRFAGIAANLLKSPQAKLVLPLDHAFAFAVVCMLAVLPAYCVALSSSIPRRLYLVVGGFALYEATYAGKIAVWITSSRFTAHHIADFAYLVSLALWFFALRTKQAGQPGLCLIPSVE